MSKVYPIFAACLSLAGCGDPTPSSGNSVATVPPAHVAVGSTVYAKEDCQGIQGHELYTVVAMSGDRLTVEQQPVGSGRTFTVPATCF